MPNPILGHEAFNHLISEKRRNPVVGKDASTLLNQGLIRLTHGYLLKGEEAPKRQFSSISLSIKQFGLSNF